MKRFQDKSVVITGAASGIGRCILEGFLREGAYCVAADIVDIDVSSFASIIGSDTERIVPIKCNVSIREQVEAALNLAVKSFRKLDIVCNNAGLSDRLEPVGELEDDTWRKILSVNLDSAMYGTRHAVRIFLEAGTQGVIVNTASLSGLHGGRGGAAYTTSKYAVVGLTKNTAFMYAPQGIRCNCICPAATRTNMTKDLAQGGVSLLGLERATAGSVGLHRQALPEEIAVAVLFLASDEACYVNGVALELDNAWSCY